MRWTSSCPPKPPPCIRAPAPAPERGPVPHVPFGGLPVHPAAHAAGLLGGRGQEDGRRLWRAHRAGSGAADHPVPEPGLPPPRRRPPPRSRPDQEGRGGPGPPAMPASGFRRTIGRPRPAVRPGRFSRPACSNPFRPTPTCPPSPRPRWRPPCASARCPLSFPAFRIIWIANLFANLGTWAQSVAAAWIITTEQSSPLLVAMIQVAAAFRWWPCPS